MLSRFSLRNDLQKSQTTFHEDLIHLKPPAQHWGPGKDRWKAFEKCSALYKYFIILYMSCCFYMVGFIQRIWFKKPTIFQILFREVWQGVGLWFKVSYLTRASCIWLQVSFQLHERLQQSYTYRNAGKWQQPSGAGLSPFILIGVWSC